MLTAAQIAEYNEDGAIVVPDVLTPEEVAHLSAVTDGFVDRAKSTDQSPPISTASKTVTPPKSPVSGVSRPRIRTIRPMPR